MTDQGDRSTLPDREDDPGRAEGPAGRPRATGDDQGTQTEEPLQRRADPTESEYLEPHLPVAASAEHEATVGDEARRLWGAVAQLNERCQRLLRVVAFEERPDYARLAQDMAMPVGSIGPTRQRCLGKLRALLEGDGWEGDHDDR